MKVRYYKWPKGMRKKGWDPETDPMFAVVDARVGAYCMKNKTDRLPPDWENNVLLLGSAEEVCNAANFNEYGDLTLVANCETQRVLFEWHVTGSPWGYWHPENEKIGNRNG